MPSLKDLAKECGVSVATVSKALNDQPDISPATRERVRAAAHRMGYLPNAAARSLKTNRTYNLGVLFVDERQSGLTHEYFSGIVARGNVIKVLGDEEEMCAFEENITKLEKYCAEYNSLKEEVIIDIIKGNAPQAEQNGNVIVFSVTGKPIIPRSENQLKLVEGFAKNDMVFAIGPAGSGKTYTAIALAVRALKNKEIKKIILSRPAVEAGEKLGFLPGDMKDKIDPYLQPLYDALQDMIPATKLKEYMELNIIQIAPLAFMRGRTLNDAVVILDEAQNTTAQQIKMFLTRMGMNTKMIVTGDMTQIDLPASQTSGLVQALRILKGVKGISFVELNKKDIVRHKLVERIVDAYERFDKEAKAEREKRKNKQLVINGERPVKLAKD